MAKTPTFPTRIQKTRLVSRETLTDRAKSKGMSIQGYLASLIERDLTQDASVYNHISDCASEAQLETEVTA